MRRGVLKKTCSFFVLLCMLFTQSMFSAPVKAEVPVNTSNVMIKDNLYTSKTTVLGVYYAMFRIPGIVVTQNGTVIAYCEARQTSGDKDPIDILMRRSTDGGQTWEAPVRLVEGVSTKTTMGNPVMISEKDSSTVHLLYSRNYSECYYMKSSDNGATWSESVNLTPVFDGYNLAEAGTWQSIATGPGHGIQLDNGRLLVPFWLSASSTSWARCSVGTIYSDDGGITWNRGEIIKHDDRTYSLGEPVVAQLSDGSVIMNIRCGAPDKLRAVSVSPNGISGWSAPYLDSALTDPGCFGSIVRFPGSGTDDKDRMLFVNVRSQTAREHLTLRMSEDDGKTWPYARLVQLGGAAYSDIAVGPDKTVYVFYEKQQPCAYLAVARFGLNWLTDTQQMAQLGNIEIPGVDMAPAFMSEIYNYDVRVEPDTTSISITPRALPNSNPAITINGQPAVSSTASTIPLSGDNTQILVQITTEGGTETNTYTVKVDRKKKVTDWKFERPATDGIHDSSGMGNGAAVLYGPEYAPGYIGKALKLDNTDYVDIAGTESTKFGTGDFTVTAWVKPDVIDDTVRTLFWYGNPTADGVLSQWWVRTKAAATSGVNKGKAQLEFSTGEKYTDDGVVIGGEVFAATTQYFLAPNEWHHVTVQRKAGVMKVFADGVESISKGSTPMNVSKGPETNMYIGKAKTGAVRNWIGYIDEVRMYNYGLDLSDIQALAAQAPVNSVALDAKITEAKAISAAAYTTKSWANLQAAIALAEAELDKENVTQAGIDQALTVLQAAINGLVTGSPVSVTASPENAGTVTGSGVFAEGDSVTVTASVYSGYTFVNWTTAGTIVSVNPVYTFTMGTAAIKLVAGFEKDKDKD